MESARQAIKSFVKGDGERTEVDESVNPAVTSEVVKPHVHEETTEAVDKEVHQDHHHTTVQPIEHKEVLPEQHTHNVVPQVEREFRHGDEEQDRSKVAAELGQFQDTSRTEQTTQSEAAAPAVTGEHVHHHVHETVQPVVHKETIKPEVVHTTIPIHEKHIAPSEHHGLSTLPMKSLDEVKQTGLNLEGGSKQQTEYEGHPHQYKAEYQPNPAPVDINPAAHEGTHDPEKTGHFGGHTDTTAAPETVHQKSEEPHGAGALAATAAGGAVAGTAATAASTHDSRDKSVAAEPSVPAAADTTPHREYKDATTESTGPVGRRTARGYSTTADEAPTFGKTHAGYLTGANGRHGPEDDQLGHNAGKSEAMGSGVAGVAAGSVASDLGKDHTRAGEVRDLDPHDTKSSVGDSSSTTAGTALAGRADGNTATGAATAASQGLGEHKTSTPGPTASEPTQSSSNAPKETTGDDNTQHASQLSDDPSMVTEKSSKLTGTGTDGSHSAVFGLTPDGHKFDETNKGTAPVPDENKQDSATGEDVGSEGVGTGKIAEQMNDPRVAEKGHEGKASHGDNDEKPGAGVNTSDILH